MVDFNANCTADEASTLIDALRDLDVYWFEEPVPPEDFAGYRRLQGKEVRLAGGEALATRAAFRALIAERLVDVVQPDVAICGGLSEMRAIAHMARAWSVSLAPHQWGGAISMAATLQFLAALAPYPHVDNAPEPVWLEFDRAPNALRDELVDEPFVARDSVVAIPDGPGLGVDVNEDALGRWLLDS
jgi:D-galactarolactone cycloisomerase